MPGKKNPEADVDESLMAVLAEIAEAGEKMPGGIVNGKPVDKRVFGTRFGGVPSAPIGSIPLSPQEAGKLDETALVPIDVDVERATVDALKVRNMLGLDRKKWDDATIRVLAEVVPRFSVMGITAKVLMRTGFDSVDQMERALQLGREMMANASLPPESKIAAGSMIAKVAEALTKMSTSLVSMADLAQPKTAADEPQQKPKNLPPQFNVQINMPAGSPPPQIAAAKTDSGETVIEASD